ncbi:MAG: YdcF family protein [Firmicutes bacterium]|nr:YdcF family protein [Bacillota bacterium]
MRKAQIFYDILLAVGIMLIICGIGTLFFANYTAGNLVLVMMGFVLMSLRFMPQKKWAKIYKALVFTGFAVFFAITAIIIFARPPKADTKVDAVIVLGCAVVGDRPSNTMVARTNAAYEYYKQNHDAIFVVSGGKGPQENISEASAMEKLLIYKGIPEEKIYIEDKASSTTENFRYSKEVLDRHFDKKPYTAAFVTNDFHCYRAGRLAKLNGFDDIACVPAETPKSAVILCYAREVLAVIKMWVFGN